MPLKQSDLQPAGGVSSRDNPTTMPRNRYLMVHDLWPQSDGSFRLRDGYTLMCEGLQPNVPIHSIISFVDPTLDSGGSGESSGGGGVAMPGGFVQAVVSGTQDSVNKIFTINPLPAPGFEPLVFWNTEKKKTPTGYIYSAGVITFVDAPDFDTILDVMVFVAS